jgi:hypothetical protein
MHKVKIIFNNKNSYRKFVNFIIERAPANGITWSYSNLNKMKQHNFQISDNILK